MLNKIPASQNLLDVFVTFSAVLGLRAMNFAAFACQVIVISKVVNHSWITCDLPTELRHM
jgi:hypothetical protein